MKYRHISKAVEETIQYISDRREGKQLPLYTTKSKLNKAIDGFSWGRIYTLCGLSGSGKSITIEELKRDLIDCNKTQNFDILSFEFEMLAIDQITRNISGKTEKSVNELYSANKEYLDSETFEQAVKATEILTKYPIYYVDEIGTVNEIKSTILSFLDEHNANKDRGLVVTIDHVLLTRGMSGQAEKEVVDQLMHTCVELKKSLTSAGYKIMFILLSQLNREIEKQERVLNPMFHFPTKNDIFAASSVYYCSDVVLILHKPAIIEGLGGYYGPPRKGYPKGLPIFTQNQEAFIYWHIIKSRFGSNQILIMLDDFVHSRVLEYSANSSN